jgi:hypothetical protein
MYKVSIKERISRVELRLYNFIVSDYVEPLKPSNQVSTVNCQIIKY